MIACVSRSLNEHEQRYEAWKGEMLAAVWGVKMMRVYLHGAQHFYLHTDHRPLLWLLTAQSRGLNPQGTKRAGPSCSKSTRSAWSAGLVQGTLQTCLAGFQPRQQSTSLVRASSHT